MSRDGWDILGISGLILVSLFFLSSLGCARTHDSRRDHLEVKLYPSRGFCWRWDYMENEIAGHTLCSERRTINGFNVVCTRKLGHRRAHHMHGADDCYWIW